MCFSSHLPSLHPDRSRVCPCRTNLCCLSSCSIPKAYTRSCLDPTPGLRVAAARFRTVHTSTTHVWCAVRSYPFFGRFVHTLTTLFSCKNIIETNDITELEGCALSLFAWMPLYNLATVGWLLKLFPHISRAA